MHQHVEDVPPPSTTSKGTIILMRQRISNLLNISALLRPVGVKTGDHDIRGTVPLQASKKQETHTAVGYDIGRLFRGLSSILTTRIPTTVRGSRLC
jgi:hypothetical protein